MSELIKDDEGMLQWSRCLDLEILNKEINEMEDWRENMEEMKLVEQLQYMLENNILTDCTFVVGPEDGETREFKAHRVLIARVSAVFEAMLLTVEMMEAKTGHVRVTDLSTNTFQLLLNFIYGKKAEIRSLQEAQDLALAADKYQMKSLFEKSLCRMCEHVTPENVWTAWKFATEMFPHDRLRKACLTVFEVCTVNCIAAHEFLEADEKDVAVLLSQDVLNVENELELVNAAVTWAQREIQRRELCGSDVRAVLEPRLLSLLRLLTIPPQLFVAGPGHSDWLSTDEKWAIIQCMHSENCTELPEYLSPSLVPRRRPTFTYYCRRTVEVRRKPSYSANCGDLFCSLIFRAKSDVDLKLLGFEIKSQQLKDVTKLVKNEHTYDENLKVEVYDCGSSLLLGMVKKEKILEFDYREHVSYNSTISIRFKQPIVLRKYRWFNISINFKKGEGFYPNARLESNAVCFLPQKVEFVFHTTESTEYLNSQKDDLIRSLIVSQ